jgi:hypothetical protein
MIRALLALGIFLLLSGILGQVYSLKTKRGVLPPETRVSGGWRRGWHPSWPSSSKSAI